MMHKTKTISATLMASIVQEQIEMRIKVKKVEMRIAQEELDELFAASLRTTAQVEAEGAEEKFGTRLVREQATNSACRLADNRVNGEVLAIDLGFVPSQNEVAHLDETWRQLVGIHGIHVRHDDYTLDGSVITFASEDRTV